MNTNRSRHRSTHLFISIRWRAFVADAFPTLSHSLVLFPIFCGFCAFLRLNLLAAEAQRSPGLICSATDSNRAVTFVVPTPNFVLTEKQSIHPQLGPQFSARWSGELKIERPGKYTIASPAKIFIDGAEITGAPVALEPGYHRLQIAFDRPAAASARSQLRWASELFEVEPVPASAFSHTDTPASAIHSEQIQRGRLLAEEFNCVACHRTTKSFIQTRGAPDLSKAGARLNPDWIYEWLDEPRRLHGWAVMPAQLGSATERTDVVTYLQTLKGSAEPAKRTVPTNGIAAKGKEIFDKIGCSQCHNEQAVRLKGIGSKLDAEQLIAVIRAPLAIDSSGRMPDCSVSVDEAMHIAAHLEPKKVPNLAPAPRGDPDRGRALVVASGCLNCHQLRENQRQLTSKLPSPAPLESLDANNGCLSDKITGAAPRFGLTSEERDALRAFVRSPDISEGPIQDFGRLTRQLRCTSCHELFEPIQRPFEANQAPPSLAVSGNKLRETWINRVLIQKKRIRPWLSPRMPHYGEVAMPLAHYFAVQAGAESTERTEPRSASLAQIQKGIHLIGKGEGGLGCVNCHDFRGHRSTGDLRGPDMTEMSERLRPDWLVRWLREPGRHVSGTAMPAFFSAMGHDEAQNHIQLLVDALALGREMPLPEGFAEDATPYLLRVKDEPILFRGFVPDVSPRAIAVGLPGMLSFCFDAKTSRLRYAWAGDFLDVTPVWANRGGMPPKILGRKFYIAPDFAPLRIGSNAQPIARFRGYTLHNKLPEFAYEIEGVSLNETISKDPRAAILIRSFEIGPTQNEILFHATAHDRVTSGDREIRPMPDGWAKIAPRGPVRFTATIPVNDFVIGGH